MGIQVVVIISQPVFPGVSGGAALPTFSYKNASVGRSLLHMEQICADSTAGPLTFTLPPLSTGAAGAAVSVLDGGGHADTNPITVAANGTDKLDGVAGGSFIMNVRRTKLTFVIKDDLSSWQAVVG